VSLDSVVDFHPVFSENTQSALKVLDVLLKNICTALIAAIRDAVKPPAAAFIASELGCAGWIKKNHAAIPTSHAYAAKVEIASMSVLAASAHEGEPKRINKILITAI
jgi:hypothetical protein